MAAMLAQATSQLVLLPFHSEDLTLLATQLGTAVLLADASVQPIPYLFLSEGLTLSAIQLGNGHGGSVSSYDSPASFLTCSLMRGLTLLAIQLGMEALKAQAILQLVSSPVS
jgi:hypothetical protein